MAAARLLNSDDEIDYDEFNSIRTKSSTRMDADGLIIRDRILTIRETRLSMIPVSIGRAKEVEMIMDIDGDEEEVRETREVEGVEEEESMEELRSEDRLPDLE